METEQILEILYQNGIEEKQVKIEAVSGGDINTALRIETNEKSYFLKYNNASLYPDMFPKEAEGLKRLAETKTIRIPAVIGTGKSSGQVYLLLEWLETASRHNQFWEDFGRQLALMHKNTAPMFGLDIDNFIGSLAQKNAFIVNWIDFFILQRLEPMWQKARDTGYFSNGESRRFNKFCNGLESLIPKETPALLHGDLWSGNFLNTIEGPVLIDPAVYFGHREMDIAMMHLFGGFSNDLFEAYNKAFPLESGWQSRIEIHNLYPLLVHTCLFGAVYAGQVKSIIARYT